jgi:hypothetical protein
VGSADPDRPLARESAPESDPSVRGALRGPAQMNWGRLRWCGAASAVRGPGKRKLKIEVALAFWSLARMLLNKPTGRAFHRGASKHVKVVLELRG